MAKIVSRARRLRHEYQLKVGRDVTVQEVAEAAGIERAALNRIELGKTSRIDFETLAKIIAFYSNVLERVVNAADVLEYDPNNTWGLESVAA